MTKERERILKLEQTKSTFCGEYLTYIYDCQKLYCYNCEEYLEDM